MRPSNQTWQGVPVVIDAHLHRFYALGT